MWIVWISVGLIESEILKIDKIFVVRFYFTVCNMACRHIEAIPPLFGTPDSDLFRGYSVRRTLVRGTPTKVQMVRVRQILCSARKNP